MKAIFKFLIVLLFFFTSLGVEAHNPDLSSTILIEKEENEWMLQVRAALTALEYEIENHYGKAAYATPEEFQTLVVEYVQKNILLQFNKGHQVVLQNGTVKLGHETTITFAVIGVPKTIQSLIVKNGSFGNISHNQSALIILKKGFSKSQFILTNNNGHTVSLSVNNAKFEIATQIQKKQYYFPIFVCILLVTLIGYLVYKNRQYLFFKSTKTTI